MSGLSELSKNMVEVNNLSEEIRTQILKITEQAARSGRDVALAHICACEGIQYV